MEAAARRLAWGVALVLCAWACGARSSLRLNGDSTVVATGSGIPDAPSSATSPTVILAPESALPSMPSFGEGAEPQTPPSASAAASQGVAVAGDPEYVPTAPELSVTVVGSPQAESPHYHALPTDGGLQTIVDELEEGEGLMYPYRQIEWTWLSADRPQVIAIGPDDELYAWTRSEWEDTSVDILRYSPAEGWTSQPLPPAPKDNRYHKVSTLDVSSDGTAWAATTWGLFTRTNGEWASAPGWEDNSAAFEGVHSDASTGSTVAFGAYDAYGALSTGVWSRMDRSFPLLLPNVAYKRRWARWQVGHGEQIAHGEGEVLWVDESGAVEVYPIMARDVGIAAAGERLVVGDTGLLVSVAGGEWLKYPVQLGGARGGPFLLDALAVSEGGDAYVSGTFNGLFHRFADGSLEFLSAPSDFVLHDASDRLLVVVDAEGIWQANPRTEAEGSGVFEAVIPSNYRSYNLSPTNWEMLDVPPLFDPPMCFDVDLGSSTGGQLLPLLLDTPKRLLFRAPEAGTFQFRVESSVGAPLEVNYMQLSILTDCALSTHQADAPLNIALQADQYVLLEAPSASRGKLPLQPITEAWLSIY